uniref:Carrier domain-containing protein n=1 Tax=Steinernema glaseri TaxID=37863 RepID=A0A1I8ACT8_9BILA
MSLSALEKEFLQKNTGVTEVKILKTDNDCLVAFVVGTVTTEPSRITVIQVKNFPMNTSGKIDKRELLKCIITINETTTMLQGTPQRLALIWQELLPGITVTSENTDFFDVGGHSLLLFKLKQRIHEVFGVSLQISTLGTNSSLKDMSTKITFLSKEVITVIKE